MMKYITVTFIYQMSQTIYIPDVINNHIHILDSINNHIYILDVTSNHIHNSDIINYHIHIPNIINNLIHIPDATNIHSCILLIDQVKLRHQNLCQAYFNKIITILPFDHLWFNRSLPPI